MLKLQWLSNKTEGIVNARMTFERETLMPTYRMMIGEAGESCAFYIVDRLGMPEHMPTTNKFFVGVSLFSFLIRCII